MGQRMNIQTYIDLGWSVFPVKGPHYAKEYSETKKPLIESWKPFQSRKPTNQEITQWKQNTPKMSLAVVTGPINNFIVVDIDSNDWMLRWPDADFGITWKSRTTRGCHFFYQWEDWMLDIPSTGSKIDDLDGFDIRGQGGYVAVPNDNDPSRSWEIHPSDQPLLKMPDWIKTFLINSLAKTKEKKAVSVSAITEGNRHDSFLRLTGKLHRAGLPQADILQMLAPLAEKTGFTNEIGPLVDDVVNRYPIKRESVLQAESVRALLMEPEPPLAWMIEGLWTDLSRGFIAGHPGVGKTWLALDMLIAVCTGGLCMNKYKPAYKAPCLLIEEEASRANLQRRIHSLARARGLGPDSLSSLFHITRQFAKIPNHADQIIDIIRANGIKFVVFDSLRRFHSGNENSSNEMQPVLDAFAQIGIMGECSVLLIHHLSKGGADNVGKSIFERMRGSSDFWAWRDCVIGVEGEEDADLATCSFQFRDAESQPSIQVRRCVGELTGAIALEAMAMDETEEYIEKSRDIITFVRTQLDGANRNAISKAVGGRKQDNLNIIKRLEKDGQLIKSGPNLVVPK